MTMDVLSNAYNKDSEIEVMVDIHEFGGAYIGDQGKPGLNSKEIAETVPRVLLPDLDLTNGWWKLETKETEEGFRERVKRVSSKLKEIAANKDEDYTVCLVTHGLFLNAFFNLLLNCEFLVESKLFKLS